MVKKNNFIGEL